MNSLAIITGSSGGIGSALVEAFNRAGYKVVAVDLNPCKDPIDGVEYLLADLSLEKDIDYVIHQIESMFGYAHILINNAAIAHFSKPLSLVSSDEMENLIKVNVLATIKLSKAFIALNEGQAFGRIINIASTRYGQNEANWELYGASKGAVISLTSSLAVSLGHKPITVNAISPGWIHCADWSELRPEDHQQHPSGRVGKPEDIVKACFYLADPENDFINGANLVIDGGMSKKMIYLD